MSSTRSSSPKKPISTRWLISSTVNSRRPTSTATFILPKHEHQSDQDVRHLDREVRKCEKGHAVTPAERLRRCVAGHSRLTVDEQLLTHQIHDPVVRDTGLCVD